MRTLSVDTQQNILSLHSQGFIINQVADQCHDARSTVQELQNKCLKNINLSSGGRPTKLSQQNKQLCIRQITSGKLETATAVVTKLRDNLNVEGSDSTVRWTL
jgi:hypothetical protein